MHRPWISLLTLASITWAGGDLARAADAEQQPQVHFENVIRPLLIEHCVKCHGPQKSESGLRLDDIALAIRGGDSGPAVQPGNPAGSLLMKAVQHTEERAMPPTGKLADHEIAALERWIKDGAVGSEKLVASAAADAQSGPVAPRSLWSLQPVRDPALPSVSAACGILNAIDRFVVARLSEEGLTPGPAADKRTLLRRTTFDLTGLPPTPAEYEAFLQDESPDAIEKAIDRLLCSPAYGERWGRHWLDVVRYADTAGETADYPVPQAYKYRNWVIRALNADMPYDQFLRDQIGGDIFGRQMIERLGLAATEEDLARYADMLTATGFIAISRRFGFDIERYHDLTIQDTIDTLGQAVLGLTLGCARCHDHKYDPITTEDYYAWYGIFASTRYSFPGSEQKKRPADLIPVLPASLVDSDACASQLIFGASEASEPEDARVQLRGDKLKLGVSVARRNIGILGGDPLPGGAGSGRAQLAEWLSRPTNPLTPRVMVNRIWQHHFGRGIVATENDFAARGQPPSHPELLDWLAIRFVKSGWSVKAMHRLIMGSSAYQQSSEYEGRAAQLDPDTRLLWRFAPRRLSAEEIRDAMLLLSGDLDCTPGGEHPFPPPEKWNFTQHSPFYAVYPSHRRSIYLMQQRLKRHPLLGLFDGADPNSTTPHRDSTTVPTQALWLMNSEFVHERAASLARWLFESVPASDRINHAFLVALGRLPTTAELWETVEFLTNYQDAWPAGDSEAKRAAWSALVRTLLARNEFLFVD